ASPVPEQVGYGGAGQGVRGADVEVEGVGQVGRVGVHQRVGDAAADVVDHDVESAELRHCRLGEAGCGVEVAEVGRDHQGAAPGRRDPLGDRFELVTVAGADDDVGAGLGERQRGRRADPPAGTGDDGHPVV